MKSIIVIDPNYDDERFETIEEAKQHVKDSYCSDDEGFHPDIESITIVKELFKIELLENNDETFHLKFVGGKE